ncbi:MAG: rhomboid family intramembrane serine protease [Gemmatimonadaceae bacterium]|nr:rhomboid family intramembrane serine protease [Gemmatimonadaceae bacterium]
MSSPHAEEQGPAGLTPAVLWLLVANVAIFFLQQTVVRAEDLQGVFAFDSTGVLARWWTPLTYAFLHGDIWHIAFNMIALWQFGPRVERLFGTGRFVRFYLWCALGGAALHYFVLRWFFPGTAGDMIGASAAVFGVMYAFAHAWPRTMLLFFGIIPMQVRWAVAGFAVMSLLLGITGGQSGVAHFAHLGGFLAAFVLVRLPAARRLSTWPERFSPAPELPEDEMPRSVPRTSGLRPQRSVDSAADPVDDVVARSNAIVQRRPPTAVPQRPVVTATVAPAQSATEEMNALLDKMSNGGGRESLTSLEHARLRELSELLRNGQR